MITIRVYFSKSTTQSKDFIPLIGSAYGLQRLFPLSQQTYAAWASYKIKSASINDVLNELENEKDHVNVTSKKDKILFNLIPLKIFLMVITQRLSFQRY